MGGSTRKVIRRAPINQLQSKARSNDRGFTTRQLYSSSPDWAAADGLGKRFDWLDKQLAGKQYLMGDKFTVADAYLFTVLRWSPRIEIDLAKWPNVKAYVDRVGARPKVQEALKAEGLVQ